MSRSTVKTVSGAPTWRRARRGMVWVCLAAAMAAGATWWISGRRPAVYEARAQIEVEPMPVYVTYSTSLLRVPPAGSDPRVLAPLVQDEQVVSAALAAVGQEVAEKAAVQPGALHCRVLENNRLELAGRGGDAQRVRQVVQVWAETAVERLRQEIGPGDTAVAQMQALADESLESWSRLRQEQERAALAGFAGELQTTNIELARDQYKALSQTLNLATTSREMAKKAVRLAEEARAMDQPVSPRPGRDALLALLATLTLGFFLVMVVALVRLEG